MEERDGLLLPVRPRMSAVLKDLKRESSSLWSCANSILEDERFVGEIRQMYASLPLVANLRCGLWYAPRFDAACYFKSTDGHNGWWNFSTTRLNMGLAELAANKGGCIIVDATRKGKRFPDSLSKTIPIWACVLNRAVARVRAHDAKRKEQRQRSFGGLGPAVHVVDTQTCISEATPQNGHCGSDGGGSDSSTSDGSREGGEPSQNQTEVAAAGVDGSQQLPAMHQQSSAARVGQQKEQQAVNGFEGDDEQRGQQVVNESRQAQQQQEEIQQHEEQPQQQQEQQEEIQQQEEQQQQEQQQEQVDPCLPLHTEPGDPRQLRTQLCADTAPCPGTSGNTSASATGSARMLSPTQEQQQHQHNHQQRVAPPLSPQLSLDEWMTADGADGQSPCRARAALHLRRRSSNSSSGGGAAGPPRQPRRRGLSTAAVSALPFFGAWAEATAAAAAAAEPGIGSVAPRGPSTPLLLPQAPCAVTVGTPAIPECAVKAETEEGPEPGVTLSCGSGSDVDGSGAVGPATPRLGGQRRPFGCSPCDGPWASDEGSPHCHGRDESEQPAGSGGGGGLQGGGEDEGARQAAPLASAGAADGGFEFPSPTKSARRTRRHPQQHGATADPHDADGGAAGAEDCGGDDCGAADAPASPPEMPLVVLNGMPHEPGVAACILDMWRSADLEELSELPPISEFPPARADAAQEARGAAPACAAQWERRHGGGGGGGLDFGAGGRPEDGRSDSAVAGTPPEEWDTALHLPLWIAQNERKQIEARLEGWVERLFEVGADVRRLSAVLSKPLRPLWISQSSVIWTNQVAQPEDLPFAPLVLVSASQPHQYKRLTSRGAEAAAAAPESGKRRRRKQQHGSGGEEEGAGRDAQAWSYVYVPGAGDDEESWSQGLTPSLFWEHHERLLAAGPSEIRSEVRRLLLRRGGAAAHVQVPSVPGGVSAALSGRPCKPQQHTLPPRGCEAAGAPAGPGCACAVGPTRILLGDATAAGAPGIWADADAVLCLGQSLPPRLEPEWRSAQLLASQGAALPPLSLALGRRSPPNSPPSEPIAILAPRRCPACGGDGGGGDTGGGSGSGSCASSQGGGSPRVWRKSSGGGVGLLAAMLKRSGGGASGTVANDAGAAGDAAGSAEGLAEIGRAEVASAAPAQRRVAGEGRGSGRAAGAQAAAEAAGAVVIPCWSVGSSASSGSSTSSSYYSTCSEDEAEATAPAASAPAGAQLRGAGSQCACGAGGGGPPRGAARVLWLPVPAPKKDRSGLKAVLPQALAFVSAHLAAGRRVLIADDDGDDACVCVATAVLLVCFSAPDAAASIAPEFLTPWPEGGTLALDQHLHHQHHHRQPLLQHRRHHQQQQQQQPPAGHCLWPQQGSSATAPERGPNAAAFVSAPPPGDREVWQPPQPVARVTMRQRLAYVTGHYAAGRPSKSMLKQVLNFFVAGAPHPAPRASPAAGSLED